MLELSLLVLLAQSWSPVAEAQAPAPPLHLSWSAPAGCPGAQHVRALLRRQTLPRGLTINGAITRDSDGFLLTLEIVGGPMRVVRELRTGDCAVLAQSAAWLIELATSADARKNGAADRNRVASGGSGPRHARDAPARERADATGDSTRDGSSSGPVIVGVEPRDAPNAGRLHDSDVARSRDAHGSAGQRDPGETGGAREPRRRGDNASLDARAAGARGGAEPRRRGDSASLDGRSAGASERPESTDARGVDTTDAAGGNDRVEPPLRAADSASPITQPAEVLANAPSPSPRAEDVDADDAIRDDAADPDADNATRDDAASPALHGRIGAAVGAMALGLGGTAPELSIDLGVSSSALDFDLRLGAVLHASRALSSNAKLSLRSYSAALSVCKEWGLAAGLLLGPCGLASGLLSSADGQGLVAGRERSAFWASLGAAARLRWQLPAGIVLMFEAGLMVPISQRPSFEVTGAAPENGALLLGFARFGGAFRIW